MKSSKTQERLLLAALRAVLKRGLPCTVGVSELEVHFGGPASGAAGGIVRRWPAEGIVSMERRFTFVREGKRTCVRVEPVWSPEVSRKKKADELEAKLYDEGATFVRVNPGAEVTFLIPHYDGKPSSRVFTIRDGGDVEEKKLFE